jgi:hypothetical protein
VKAFRLDQRRRMDLGHRLDQLVQQRVVGLALEPRVAHAEVERIVEQPPIVGADVEVDRKRLGRVDAGAGSVERELADRDPHPADALVAQPEDRRIVRDDGDPAAAAGAAQELADVPAVQR